MVRNINNVPLLKKDVNLNLIQDSYSDRAFRGDYTGTNLIYRGYARPGAGESEVVWQVAKLAYDGSNNVTSIKWPNGSSEYAFTWTDRAAQTYV